MPSAHHQNIPRQVYLPSANVPRNIPRPNPMQFPYTIPMDGSGAAYVEEPLPSYEMAILQLNANEQGRSNQY